MQNVVAYWRIRIGSGSQNLKGLGSRSLLVGSGSVPDLLICGSHNLCCKVLQNFRFHFKLLLYLHKKYSLVASLVPRISGGFPLSSQTMLCDFAFLKSFCPALCDTLRHISSAQHANFLMIILVLGRRTQTLVISLKGFDN